jgi:hypothetical protein
MYEFDEIKGVDIGEIYRNETNSSLKVEDPVTRTAFLSKSEEAYCMQTEHVIRSISLL